jgi:hypothetical protein
MPTLAEPGAPAAAPKDVPAMTAAPAPGADPKGPGAIAIDASRMTPAVALAARQAQQESGMAAWVVCAWQFSNITNYQKMTSGFDAKRIRCGQLCGAGCFEG